MNQSNTITGLPAAPTMRGPLTDRASLLNSVILAYHTAVANLCNLSGKEYTDADHRLSWGSRKGSKIEGVREPFNVMELFRRIIPNLKGGQRPPRTNSSGNNVYCFNLTHHYAGKGKTTYARVSDVIDKGPVFQAALEFGKDRDETTDSDIIKLQAPNLRYVASNVVTVVMSSDNKTFIEWYCGELKKLYTMENIHEIMNADGSLRFESMWLELGVDYERRAEDKHRKAMYGQFHNNQPQEPVPVSAAETISTEFINSVAEALEKEKPGAALVSSTN